MFEIPGRQWRSGQILGPPGRAGAPPGTVKAAALDGFTAQWGHVFGDDPGDFRIGGHRVVVGIGLRQAVDHRDSPGDGRQIGDHSKPQRLGQAFGVIPAVLDKGAVAQHPVDLQLFGEWLLMPLADRRLDGGWGQGGDDFGLAVTPGRLKEQADNRQGLGLVVVKTGQPHHPTGVGNHRVTVKMGCQGFLDPAEIGAVGNRVGFHKMGADPSISSSRWPPWLTTKKIPRRSWLLAAVSAA
ncbi:hypothetical protein DSECCO2_117850 [anaerobic digester metagenome]